MNAEVKLPVTLIDVVDVKRAEREVAAIDDFIREAAIRQPGKQPRLPRTSQTLDDLAKLNGLNLLKSEERRIIAGLLNRLSHEAPSVQISFAAEPSPVFMAKLVTWFRQEVHPLTLIQVGLQPSIAAGCVVRTPNKYFDLSLRRHFKDKRQVLISSLEALTK